jgi:thiol-disulfide isomerase/thioredoxin
MENLQLVDNKGESRPMSSLSGKVVGFYFSAHWCPPCRGFTPVLAKIYNETKAQGHPFEIIFVSSDRQDSDFTSYFNTMPWLAIPFAERDVANRLKSAFQVRGIPALILLDAQGNVLTKDGRSAVRNGWPFVAPGEVKTKPATTAAQTAAPSATPASSWAGVPSGLMDLSSLVDHKRCQCLNEAEPRSVESLTRDTPVGVESDADEQLLIMTAFRDNIKLRHIGLQGKNDGRLPATIKLFLNRLNMDFGDAEGEALEQWTLGEGDWKAIDGSTEVRALLTVKPRKFNNVASLTLFVETNQGDEETSALTQLRYFGVPIAGFNMDNLKKSG